MDHLGTNLSNHLPRDLVTESQGWWWSNSSSGFSPLVWIMYVCMYSTILQRWSRVRTHVFVDRQAPTYMQYTETSRAKACSFSLRCIAMCMGGDQNQSLDYKENATWPILPSKLVHRMPAFYRGIMTCNAASADREGDAAYHHLPTT